MYFFLRKTKSNKMKELIRAGNGCSLSYKSVSSILVMYVNSLCFLKISFLLHSNNIALLKMNYVYIT